MPPSTPPFSSSCRDRYVAIALKGKACDARQIQAVKNYYGAVMFPTILKIASLTFNKPLPSLGIAPQAEIYLWGPVLVQIGGEGQNWLDAYSQPVVIQTANIDRVRFMPMPYLTQGSSRLEHVECQFTQGG